MFTKVELYNVALSALLLQRQLNDVTTENSNEKAVLNQFWNIAFFSALEDMDLDSTSTKATLELITSTPAEPYNQLWDYVYKYPPTCVNFRSIFSGYQKDSRATHIPKAVEMYGGQKVILTREASAVGQFIPNDISLSHLSPMAGMCIAYKLASLSAPLIVGKGARTLKESIMEEYKMYKHAAQEHDRNENFNFHEPWVESEFVAARMMD